VPFDERIRVQQSVFTLHPNPQIELEDQERITKIIIPKAVRASIRRALARYHIGRAYLFPGLDALSQEIVDMHSEKDY
jgi:hypothetical protein